MEKSFVSLIFNNCECSGSTSLDGHTHAQSEQHSFPRLRLVIPLLKHLQVLIIDNKGNES